MTDKTRKPAPLSSEQLFSTEMPLRDALALVDVLHSIKENDLCNFDSVETVALLAHKKITEVKKVLFSEGGAV